LKRLSRRITEALVKELATRAMPALVGLGTPRSTRRTSGQLDLRRTIRQNLGTAYPSAEGPKLAPKSFAFRARTKKSLDWRIVLVVDVSGSMEPSVIHSAIMAGILGGLPAISTHFLAVNDRVVDLTEAAPDPLELLLSVAIGGGTLLAKGLRHARSLLTVPSRSIVVLVSDFEEGGSVGELVSEVRALRDSGAVLLGLAALGENHAPRYHRAIAAQLVEAGMPIAALSPVELASWVGERIRGAR
jgi:Mg-chelatase subunit ChlD